MRSVVRSSLQPFIKGLATTAPKNRRMPIVLFLVTLLTMLAGLLFAGPTAAQDNQEQIRFDIPAGTLESALVTFSTVTGVSVSFTPDVVSGLESRRLVGRFTPSEALNQLLSGSGLQYRFTSANALTLQRAVVQQDNEPLQLAPIMVEGELLDRTLQDTQSSVAVITGEELEKSSDSNLEQLVERIANAATSNGGENFVIRGIDEFGATGGTGAAGTPTITTTIDGARISNFRRRDTTSFSTWDLEQIEVLRGPQSTQTGRNALAGAVIVRSKDPTYEPEFKLRGGVGNGDTFEGAVAANLPLIEETLAFRVAADFDRTDGFTTNPTIGIDDQDSEEFKTIRGSLRFDPTEDLSALLKITYFDADEGLGRLDGPSFPDRVNFGNVQDRQETQLASTNLRVGYDIGDSFRLEGETTYVDRQSEFVQDGDGIGTASVFTGDNDASSIEQELRLSYEDARLRTVVGAFYTNIDEMDEGGGSFAFGGLGTATAIQVEDTERTNWAIFGEAEYEVLSGLRLVIGARYDRESVDQTITSSFSTNDPPIVPFLPSSSSNTASATFDAFLPKAGVIYELSENVSLGFTYQRGYRAGGATTNIFDGVTTAFDPEFTDNYELSFRSQWFDDRLTVNTNAFWTQWRDQQVVVQGLSGNSNDFNIENAGSSRLFGGELEIRAAPTPGLEVFGALGYANTEFRDFVTGGIQLAGNRFAFDPELTASFGATYQFENGFVIGGDASFTDSAFADPQNTPLLQTDSRFLVNLRAGYEAENWSIFAHVDNVFDENYITRPRPGPGGTLGDINAGDPVTFGVIGQVRF